VSRVCYAAALDVRKGTNLIEDPDQEPYSNQEERPSDFNLGNFLQRLEHPDPWEKFFQSRQSLKRATAFLRTL